MAMMRKHQWTLMDRLCPFTLTELQILNQRRCTRTHAHTHTNERSSKQSEVGILFVTFPSVESLRSLRRPFIFSLMHLGHRRTNRTSKSKMAAAGGESDAGIFSANGSSVLLRTREHACSSCTHQANNKQKGQSGPSCCFYIRCRTDPLLKPRPFNLNWPITLLSQRLSGFQLKDPHSVWFWFCSGSHWL